MRIRALILAAALAVVGSPITGNATGCNGKISTFGSGPATFYLDDRSATTPFVDGAGSYLYTESNGIAGLQTGGTEVVFATIGDPDDAGVLTEIDHCYNHLRTTPSDTFIF